MALSLDPSYSLAYSNLGCALLLQDNVYKAIATLQDALKLAPEQPELLNNLGVALAQADHPEKAKASLARARDLAPTYAAPVFNLGKIAYAENRHPEAQRLWAAYVMLEPGSPWVERLRMLVSLPLTPVPSSTPQPAETMMGVAIAKFAWEMPSSWGKPILVSQLPLQEEPFTLALYAHGAMTLVHNKEIVLIKALEGYRGTSSRGIAIGSAAQDVLTQYGRPSRLLTMPQGETWIYEGQGIAFQFRNKTVVSWLLF
jgi:tetratricopeptide (TPR) repeat protein